MPGPERTERVAPTTAAEARALARDCARFLIRFGEHVDTVWGLAYEPAGAAGDGGRGSGDVRDVGSVGDARVRDALRVIARTELVLLAEIEKVMNHLNAGPGPDHNLRGSLISKAEYGRRVKDQLRRITTGESERPLVPQPLRPGRGNR